MIAIQGNKVGVGGSKVRRSGTRVSITRLVPKEVSVEGGKGVWRRDLLMTDVNVEGRG